MGTGGGNRRIPFPEQKTTSTVEAPTGGGGGGGPVDPVPAPVAPSTPSAPSTPPPSMDGLLAAFGGSQQPQDPGAAQMSGLSITDQGIGMRVPPSLAALLGRKVY